MFRKILSGLFLLLLILAALAGATFFTPPASAEGALPVLVGFYPSGNLYNTVGELDTLNAYFGRPTISLAGSFVDIESPGWVIWAELNAAWGHGYVPFINLGAGGEGTPRTAQQIADGVIDPAIRRWAQIVKQWSANGQKRVFIAPLQEMNGAWTTYYGDAANFRRAFIRIRQIFEEEGVPANVVSWVFAPNGWHDPARPSDAFEEFYPGHSVVDVVGFSSFNFGDCWSYTDSQSYEEIYKPYLDRMAAMAPGKPIFIAEIGSVAYGLDRSAWFADTLSKIGAYPGVRAILYFNRRENPANYLYPPICNPVDYSLDSAPDGQGGPAAEGKETFKAIVTQAPYGYWAPSSSEMATIAFGRPSFTFEDVWAASAFSGKNSTPYYQPWVERLVNAGITSGCMSRIVDFNGVTDFTYRYYCPESPVTRAQMAVFLLKAINGSSYSPPDVVATFPDTAGHWAEDWIEALKSTGVTGGFPDGTYRPETSVSRAQMAVFLLKAIHGSSYEPPNVPPTFSDTAGHWAEDWIEALRAAGITGGFPDGTYRPEEVVTRGQMAVFLVKAFGLP